MKSTIRKEKDEKCKSPIPGSALIIPVGNDKGRSGAVVHELAQQNPMIKLTPMLAQLLPCPENVRANIIVFHTRVLEQVPILCMLPDPPDRVTDVAADFGLAVFIEYLM